MFELFNAYFYLPTLAALGFVYDTFAFHNLLLAIVLLTAVVRVVLFPIFYKSAKDQSIMQRLQPHVRKIQLDHKDDKEKQAKMLLDLYKRYKVNPFSGMLLLLLQIPVFIALFQVFKNGLTPAVFGSPVVWGLDLSTKGYVLPAVAALAQYWQMKLAMDAMPKMPAEENPMASATKIMLYVGPIFTLFLLGSMPSALSVYWTTSGLFSIVQQMYINKHLPKLSDEPEKSR